MPGVSGAIGGVVAWLDWRIECAIAGKIPPLRDFSFVGAFGHHHSNGRPVLAIYHVCSALFAV